MLSSTNRQLQTLRARRSNSSLRPRNSRSPRADAASLAHREPGATDLAAAAFTLIELLVVIAIIAILAGLGFAGVNGALKTARKAEVRAMANQIKLGMTAYYAEYGIYPTNQRTDAAFLNMMSGAPNITNNRRQVRFLEVPPKFTNSTGLVTPLRFYGSGQSNFTLIVDTNYDGKIRLPDQSQETGGNIAVYVLDPDSPSKYIGTW